MAEDETERLPWPRTSGFLPAEVALPRIEAIVANARTVWLGQIGFLAFITLTLFNVRDVDFFSVTSTTQLPILNVAIPTTTFFWTAAWLAAILHTYLHLFLLRLWDALAEAPPRLDGLELGERVFPWLVNDWALRRRPDRPLEHRPMDRLADFVTLVLVWLATPLLLLAFWWRSMPAHDAWLTLAIAGALGLSLFTSARGWYRANARLRHPGVIADGGRDGTRLPRTWRRGGIALGVALVALSLLRTEIGDIQFGPFRSEGFTLAGIDLEDAEIAVRPDDWRDHELARRRFRIAWCRDNGVSPLACEAPEADAPGRARTAWCKAKEISDCSDWFRRSDAAFAAEWEEERNAYLGGLVKPSLSGRDLRRASARRAFLAGIDLSQARLEGADLRDAGLEGANLSWAMLEGADLSWARLEGADLYAAGLEGADLIYARLERANLSWARLEGADLYAAGLEGADLIGATLEGADLQSAMLRGADLSWARLGGASLWDVGLEGAFLWEAQLERTNLREAVLEGADLSSAVLEGADLRDAEFRSVAWLGATLGPSLAHGTDFTGGRGMTQSQLDLVIGDDDTTLPLDRRGNQLHVWTCWEDEAAEQFVKTWAQHLDDITPEQMRQLIVEQHWACTEGNPRRPVGKAAEEAEEVEESAD